MFRRIAVAAAALLVGLGTAGTLLALAGGSPARDAYVASADLPAGSAFDADGVHLARVSLDAAQFGQAFSAQQSGQLFKLRASHDLVAGQLLQRSDTTAGSSSGGGRALVLLPLKSSPPLRAGDRVDLLLLSGSADRTAVTLFAAGVRVAAVAADGPVLDVASRQAAAFVYAGAALRLVAVPVGPGAGSDELPVSSAAEAGAAAR
jgi:SAF domain-containing protein